MDFRQKLQSLTIQDFLSATERLPDPTGDPVSRSYGPMLEFVQRNASRQDRVSLLGIAHAVYGWMPTMLDFNDEDPFPEFWSETRAGSLEEGFLDRLKVTVNNSIVGASKVLHFVNPDRYAIFDSRVYRGITGEFGYDYRVNNVENYHLYVEHLRGLAGDSASMAGLRQALASRGIVSSMSDLRALELCLFLRP